MVGGSASVSSLVMSMCGETVPPMAHTSCSDPGPVPGGARPGARRGDATRHRGDFKQYFLKNTVPHIALVHLQGICESVSMLCSHEEAHHISATGAILANRTALLSASSTELGEPSWEQMSPLAGDETNEDDAALRAYSASALPFGGTEGEESDSSPAEEEAPSPSRSDAAPGSVAEPLHAAESDGAPPRPPMLPAQQPVRRRMLRKAPPPAWARAASPEMLPAPSPGWVTMERARNTFRKTYCLQHNKDGRSYRERWRAASVAWSALTPERRQSLASSSSTPESAARSRSRGPHGKRNVGGRPKAPAPAVLMTWNGPWLADDPGLQEGWVTRHLDPDEFAKNCKEMRPVQALLDEFWQSIWTQAQQEQCAAVTVSVELSLQSDHPRVDLHAYLTIRPCPEACMAKRTAVWEKLQFRQQICSHYETLKGSGRNRNDMGVRQGHFYLQAKKLGHVACRTSFRKWFDFPVSARWVWDLFRLRKISEEQAGKEFLNARDRASAHMKELRLLASLVHAQAVELAWKGTQQAGLGRPFKAPVAEEKEFLGQFTHHLRKTPGWKQTPAALVVMDGGIEILGALPRRCKFLVYNGPTRLGKTERACHWFGPSETLVLNCQNVTTPSMREMMTGKWRAVVYDESDWRLPASQRALLQSAARPITLGQSNCNESVYSVVMHGVPQIICSNDFWKGKTPADMEAEMWIRENSYIVDITEKTWED